MRGVGRRIDRLEQRRPDGSVMFATDVAKVSSRFGHPTVTIPRRRLLEGAKFWAGVCAELAKRGIRDVLIVCCDGLTGFGEAIEASWPQTTVQTCTVHYPEVVVMPMPANKRLWLRRSWFALSA
jgi:hypothetical protein